VDACQARAEVDPARIGIMGWSHGGFITAHLLMRGARAQVRRRRGDGAHDQPRVPALIQGPRLPAQLLSTQDGIQGLPFEKREEYIKRSPYYHVDSLSRPILVHVATNDTDADFVESQPLIDALVRPQAGALGDQGVRESDARTGERRPHLQPTRESRDAAAR
jgi:dipeptidyl aminopeptidase/acylaminoacyl peptidase